MPNLVGWSIESMQEATGAKIRVVEVAPEGCMPLSASQAKLLKGATLYARKYRECKGGQGSYARDRYQWLARKEDVLAHPKSSECMREKVLRECSAAMILECPTATPEMLAFGRILQWAERNQIGGSLIRGRCQYMMPTTKRLALEAIRTHEENKSERNATFVFLYAIYNEQSKECDLFLENKDAANEYHLRNWAEIAKENAEYHLSAASEELAAAARRSEAKQRQQSEIEEPLRAEIERLKREREQLMNDREKLKGELCKARCVCIAEQIASVIGDLSATRATVTEDCVQHPQLCDIVERARDAGSNRGIKRLRKRFESSIESELPTLRRLCDLLDSCRSIHDGNTLTVCIA